MNEKTDPAVMAFTIAVVVRVSELLSIPIEDAARIYIKVAGALSEKKPS